jgi:hypothetical protein
MPLVQDSMDVFVFQKLEEKTSRINDIWFRGDRGNVLDLESLNPEEIKLALITDVDRLVRMFFDQEREQLFREKKKNELALDALRAVQRDIQEYKNYREKSLELIRNFKIALLAQSYMQQIPKAAEEGEFNDKRYKKGKDLKEEIETLLNATEAADRDILALGRKIENSYAILGVYLPNRYQLHYFKEYVGRVRKTERAVLKPKGYSLNSDLGPAVAQYEAEKQAITDKINSYRGDSQSPRWEELRTEIEQKKSALQVEGRSAESRAEEFGRLNYLLQYRMNSPEAATAAPQSSVSLLELEALALELELTLLSF